MKITHWAVWRDAGGSSYIQPIGEGVTPEEAAAAIEAAGGGIGYGFDLEMFHTEAEAEAHANKIRGKVEEF